MDEKKKLGRPPRPIEAGTRFGKLVVLGEWYVEDGRTWQLCQCDCGEQKYILAKVLKKGTTKSCGCGRADNINRVREERLRKLKERKSR